MSEQQTGKTQAAPVAASAASPAVKTVHVPTWLAVAADALMNSGEWTGVISVHGQEVARYHDGLLDLDASNEQIAVDVIEQALKSASTVALLARLHAMI